MIFKNKEKESFRLNILISLYPFEIKLDGFEFYSIGVCDSSLENKSLTELIVIVDLNCMNWPWCECENFS